MALTGPELVNTLRALGFYEFLLPWVFAFAIVYGLLIVANLFGDANKKVSAAIALVVAFFVTAYGGPMMASFFTSIFGGATIILAGILVVVLLVAMVGFKPADAGGLKRNSVLIALVIIGVILFIVSTGVASGIGYWGLMSPDLLALILVLIIIVAAVYLITRPEGGGKAEAPPPAKP